MAKSWPAGHAKFVAVLRLGIPLYAIAPRANVMLDDRPQIIDLPLPLRAAENPVRLVDMLPSQIVPGLNSNRLQMPPEPAFLRQLEEALAAMR